MDTCKQCGGLIIPPGISYNYSGPVCLCSRRILVTPMPQAEIDEALVLAMDADKREIERLQTELAASQAREKVQSEALDVAKRALVNDEFQLGWCVDRLSEVIALPTDDTALREMLVRAQEEMRERCIEEIRGVGGIDAIEVERLIRALEVKP